MSIENRNLKPGTKLVARYKGKNHAAEVVKDADGLRYRLDDGREFKSPSSAGKRGDGRQGLQRLEVLEHRRGCVTEETAQGQRREDGPKLPPAGRWPILVRRLRQCLHGSRASRARRLPAGPRAHDVRRSLAAKQQPNRRARQAPSAICLLVPATTPSVKLRCRRRPRRSNYHHSSPNRH
jgi:hypothetical protein